MKRLLFFLFLVSSFAHGQVGNKYIYKVYYANSYGCVHDGVTNDQPAIRRAIAAAKAAGGGEVHLGAGTYAVSSTILIDTSSITFSGEGASTIILATADIAVGIITAIPSTNPPTIANFFHDIFFKNFSIQASVAQTTGSAIYTTYTHSCTVANVVIGHIRTQTAPNTGLSNFFDGIHFENESNFKVDNTQIYAWHCGVYVTGKQVGNGFFSTNNFDGLITGNTFILGDTTKWHAADTTYGIHIAGGAGGVQFEEGNIDFFTNAIHVDKNGNGLQNANLFFGHAFAADLSGVDGIYLGAGSFLSAHLNGCWSSSGGNAPATGHGVHVATPNPGAILQVAGGAIFGNSGYGIYMEDGILIATGITFKAPTSNTLGDVFLGATVTSATIVGCGSAAITNSSAIIPTQFGNGASQLFQFSNPTTQLSMTSTGTTGQSALYMVNNSGNYLTPGVGGSAATGNFALGFPNANLASIVGNGTSALVLGTSGIKPIAFATNATGSVGPQMKIDSNSVYVTASATGSVPLIIRKMASQTADLLDIVDEGSNKLIAVTNNGGIDQAKNQNAPTKFAISNNSAGASAATLLTLTGSTFLSQLQQYGSGTTPYGALAANSANWYTNSTTMVMMVDNGSGHLDFAVGSGSGPAVQNRMFANGNFTVGSGTDAANGKLQVTGDIALEAAGNKLIITEGSNGRVGQTTLVAGTKAITITGLTTSSRAFPGFVAQGGTSTTVYEYTMVCTANTLTITAVTVAGATVVTDTSTLNYFVIN